MENIIKKKDELLEISMNKDTLLLQKEIVEKQLELAKLQMTGGFMTKEVEINEFL